MFERSRTAEILSEEVLSDEKLLGRTDGAWSAVGRAHRDLLELIAEVGRREAWRAEGANDLAHWVAMRYHLSAWKAHRWVHAAEALSSLPLVGAALGGGRLGIDQVAELTRFATPETERDLLGWAEARSAGAIAHRADLERRRERAELASVERERSVRWGYSHDGMRFELEAELPADQGALVASALDRLAERIPASPEEVDQPWPLEARRADALVALCVGPVSADPSPSRASIVMHAQLETLVGPLRTAPNAEVERGPVLAPETLRRLACDAGLQVSLDDAHGTPLMLGRRSRTPSAAMVGALRRRDRTCRFPGCERVRYTDAHHVVWWSRGGGTDLANLVLLCGFHHRLVHEGGWRLQLEPDAIVRWFRPNGERYRAGPGPPVGVGS
jgi:hypothetical protein